MWAGFPTSTNQTAETIEQTRMGATNLTGAPQTGIQVPDFREDTEPKSLNPTRRIINMWAGFPTSTNQTRKTIEETLEGATNVTVAPQTGIPMPAFREDATPKFRNPARRIISMWAGFPTSTNQPRKTIEETLEGVTNLPVAPQTGIQMPDFRQDAKPKSLNPTRRIINMWAGFPTSTDHLHRRRRRRKLVP
jgi:hypothetical protein